MIDYFSTSGKITLKYNEEVEDWMIIEWFCNFLPTCCPETIQDSPEDETFWFGFSGAQCYPEEDVLAFLTIIEPYTISGEITYLNDADEYYFRHIFDEKKKAWIEQEGWVEYEKVGEPISAIISRKGLHTFSYDDEYVRSDEFDWLKEYD